MAGGEGSARDVAWKPRGYRFYTHSGNFMCVVPVCMAGWRRLSGQHPFPPEEKACESKEISNLQQWLYKFK